MRVVLMSWVTVSLLLLLLLFLYFLYVCWSNGMLVYVLAVLGCVLPFLFIYRKDIVWVAPLVLSMPLVLLYVLLGPLTKRRAAPGSLLPKRKSSPERKIKLPAPMP